MIEHLVTDMRNVVVEPPDDDEENTLLRQTRALDRAFFRLLGDADKRRRTMIGKYLGLEADERQYALAFRAQSQFRMTAASMRALYREKARAAREAAKAEREAFRAERNQAEKDASK